MALVTKFQGSKTLSILLLSVISEETEKSGGIPEVTPPGQLAIFGPFRSDLAPLCSPLRSVVRLFSPPATPSPQRLYSYGRDPGRPLRKDKTCLSLMSVL